MKGLKDIIRSININIVASFFLILLFLIIIISIVYTGYKKKEEQIISQKLNATFGVFNTKLSQKLISITKHDNFIQYLHAGWMSRAHRYAPLLAIILYTDLEAIKGINIYNDLGENIFAYGTNTEDFITLNLCYLNRRFLNFDVGICSYSCMLYFDKRAIVAELKKINPELIDCTNCGKSLIIANSFGDFPVARVNNMNIDLTVKKSPDAILWQILAFVTGILLALVIWNVNRIKKVFKKNLYDPIIEITSKIKEHTELPTVETEELFYLAQQIDQWKNQIVELERLKAQEKANEDKFKMMQSVGASIAHELRTPLRAIISGIIGIEKYLPILLKNYDQVKVLGLVQDVIPAKQIDLLHKVLANLKAEGESANVIIDMFLMKIREAIASTLVTNKLSIATCVNEALNRYVFQKNEKDLIEYNATNEFIFSGDTILTEHILFNLLKNALYYIAKAKKGKIYIYFKRINEWNELCFKDTGFGIVADDLPYIFDKFYSKTEGGVGIGLSFCKMAMEWMGGKITCESVAGEYTEFILYFPIL